MPHGRDGPWSRLLDAVWVLQLFGRQRLLLVGHAKRYLQGQRIVTAVVESRVNWVIGRRRAKKQPMRWSRHGAHLLVQIRVAVLESGLQDASRRGYPRFQMPGRRDATPT